MPAAFHTWRYKCSQTGHFADFEQVNGDGWFAFFEQVKDRGYFDNFG